MPLLRLLKADREATPGNTAERGGRKRTRKRPFHWRIDPTRTTVPSPHPGNPGIAPSPAYRKVLWTLIILVGVLIAWSCIGKISVVATAPGKFIPDGRVKQIQPLESSIVKAIHFKEGQHVRAGDLLLEALLAPLG